MKYSNHSVRSANGFKTSASKLRPTPAQSEGGRCEKCERTINRGDMVIWSRQHGLFHAPCYRILTSDIGTPGASSLDADAVQSIVANAIEGLKSNVPEPVNEKVLAKLIDAAMAKFAPREIKVVVPGKITKAIKHAHVMLEKLLFVTGLRRHSYLYGPPGSGKSTAAMHAAKALGLEYGYIALNPQTPESRLLGFKDASGKYQPTVLFDMYKNGGVFCIDEMDNGSAALLTTLNGLLENGIGSFPCGMIERHKDFVVVGTGNTAGRGGNLQFPERRAFDAAFAERFAYLRFEYDEVMERHVAFSKYDKAGDWVDWVQNVRRFAVANDPRLVVSPRATFAIADFLAQPKSPFAIAETLDAVLFKGVEVERVNRIMSACPMPSAA